jgi:cyclic pyranopterin phosphate synthase
MINITHKSATQRSAIASATLKVSMPETLEAIRNNTVPKGNVLESARVAALFAVKKTADVIPDCHPLPVEFTQVSFELSEKEIGIRVEVQTIYKTGVEVEAMYGASVAALTLYDMLKPIDKGIEVSSVKLLEKHGGKSDFNDAGNGPFSAAVIVCSDSIHSGKKEDKAGKAVMAKLKKCNVETSTYEIIPDEISEIQERIRTAVAAGLNMIIVSGGTGLSPRDNTPEAVKPLIDREIPGIMETARAYGQQRMPYSMLSRGVAGFAGNTLVLTVPGSTRGAEETMDALFPYVLHLFFVKKGKPHGG